MYIKDLIGKDPKSLENDLQGNHRYGNDPSKTPVPLAKSTLAELKKIKQKDLVDIIEQISTNAVI